MDALQDRYSPLGSCFGCGPTNPQGLRIKSIVQGDRVVCDWTPAPHHQAFPRMLNGGICGALLDCHSNWTAAHHLMGRRGVEAPPCTVTAEFHVKLLRPTPLEKPLHLWAQIETGEPSQDRAVVLATLESDGKVRATCRGVFVAVTEGHPAYHRW